MAFLGNAAVTIFCDAEVTGLSDAIFNGRCFRHNASGEGEAIDRRGRGRRTSAVGKLAIVPRILTHVEDDGMAALSRVAARVTPPDFTKARNLEGKDLLAIGVVQAVEEVVDVKRIRHLAHDAVERQEPIHAAPIEDAVIFDDRVGTKDRAFGGDCVKLKDGIATHKGRADQAVCGPEQARRRVTGTATKGLALDYLLACGIDCAATRARQVCYRSGHAPADIARRSEKEEVRAKHDDTAVSHTVRGQCDLHEGCRSGQLAVEKRARGTVDDRAEVGGDLRNQLGGLTRAEGVHDVELPHIVCISREAGRGGAVADDGRVIVVVNVEALDFACRAAVDVGQVVLGVADHGPTDLREILVDRAKAADLAG